MSQIKLDIKSDLLEFASRLLPQAVWYNVQIETEGMLVLDTFSINSDVEKGYGSVHFRLLFIAGDTDDNWKKLQEHHSTICQRVQKNVPNVPLNAIEIGHVVCLEDYQNRIAYKSMRKIAEKISKAKNLVFADLSTTRPKIRFADKLDIPLYKLISTDYQRKDLPQKPLLIECKEKRGSEKLTIISRTLSVTMFYLLIPFLVFMSFLTVVTIKHWHLGLVIGLDFFLLLAFTFAYYNELICEIHLEGINVISRDVILLFYKRNEEKGFVSWDVLEEVQVTVSGLNASEEQFSIVSDENIYQFPTWNAKWIWQRIMVWLSENKSKLRVD